MNTYLNGFTIDDCYEILKQEIDTSDCTVQSFEFCPFNKKLGFLGDHCFLNIHYRDGYKLNSMRFFAKAMCTTESQRVFAVETGAFLKECHMYQKLVPKLRENDVHLIRECVPICYSVSEMNYLIFEDLKSLGYEPVSQRECMSLECVKLALETLAKLHCTTLILEEKVKQETGTPYVLTEEFPRLFKEAFYTATKCSVDMINATKKGALCQIDLFEDECNLDVELFKNLTCKTFDQFKEIVKPSATFRNTICHGDLWSFNVMFKFDRGDPVDCKIIDFQTYRYAPPAQDVLGFLYLTTDRQFRTERMSEMLKFYYDRVSEILDAEGLNVKKILPHGEFIESCDYYKIFNIAQSINHTQLIMAPTDVASGLFDVPGELQKVLYEDKSTLVLDLCSKDPVYQKKMEETIMDLRDAFIEKGLLELTI